MQFASKPLKTKLYYTRDVTPKRITSGGSTHGLAPGYSTAMKKIAAVASP